MVNIHYRVVHNLITCQTHPNIERIISDYLEEYPEDLERLHSLILKAHSVVVARGDNGKNV